MTEPLTTPELAALSTVMSARYENIVETRQQTGDAEYEQHDEDECSSLLFAIDDFGATPEAFDACSSLDHLYDAIWVALDTPEAFDELNTEALRSAAHKVNYPDATPE